MDKVKSPLGFKSASYIIEIVQRYRFRVGNSLEIEYCHRLIIPSRRMPQTTVLYIFIDLGRHVTL